jgi:hypothetical protein
VQKEKRGGENTWSTPNHILNLKEIFSGILDLEYLKSS